MSELGFIFHDGGDRIGLFQGERTVSATRAEAVERFAAALRREGGRYDLTVSTVQVEPDHVRARFTWWRSCE